MARFAVVIATHDYCYPLEKCIEGHLKLCQQAEDLIFVDNGSGGRLAQLAEAVDPALTAVVNETNGFFCGGYNAGLSVALDRGYDYILIVNADTEVLNPDYVAELIAIADDSPGAAFVGPRVSNGNPTTIQNTIMQFPWFYTYCLSWLAGLWGHRNRSETQQRLTEVDFLNGVCVLCRGSALEEVGLLDEVMGGYVEDADWSERARDAGWTSLFAPVSSIIHYQQESEYQHFSLKTFMLRRNHIYWHRKHGRYFQALGFAITSTCLAIVRAAFAFAVQRNAASHWRYLRRHVSVALRIIRGDSPDTWFGPPLGPFP